MLTLKGSRRSRDFVSVNDMNSDCTTGQAVNIRNSTQNGMARIQAARACRRPWLLPLSPGPGGESLCGAGAAVAVVGADMAYWPVPIDCACC